MSHFPGCDPNNPVALQQIQKDDIDAYRLATNSIYLENPDHTAKVCVVTERTLNGVCSHDFAAADAEYL